MKPIKVTLSLAVVPPLLDVIKSLGEDLKTRTAVPAEALPQADPDLNESWTAGLLEAQISDFSVMLSLFGEDFFSDGVVQVDSSNGEPIVRACSALRLRLRERYLQSLGDEALEAGEVEMGSLPEAVRKPFMCYLFLATIQELIIQHMDESIAES